MINNTNKGGLKGNSSFEETVVAVTASSKEALLEALNTKNFLFSASDDYRLVLFNPTDERIDKAKKLISKDKPWKGRQDIWFTNKPLLKSKGKIAFLFPGFDLASDSEIESIATYFNIPVAKRIIKGNLLLDQAFHQLRNGDIIDSSLKKIGVFPDMNAGHSLGEWFAAKAGGLVNNESVEELLESMDPEKYKMDDVYFIAVSCGADKLEPWLNKIPELYLSNDNCPSQVLLCGTGNARDSLIKELKAEGIFHQVLAFQSGFHSPFIKNKLYLLDEALELVKIQKNTIPIWSATNLELYPKEAKEFREITIQHLLQTVRFRELIDKLYQQQDARVFIQIGSGSLIGFVDDILKNQEYAGITSYNNTRSSLEQLRRIVALLFIEGRKIDLQFLGVQETTNNTSNKTDKPVNSLVKEVIPVIKKEEVFNIDSLFIQSDHPVMQAMNENIKEMILMQRELAELIQKKEAGLLGSRTRITTNSQVLTPSISSPVIENTLLSKKQGTAFEEPLYVTLDEHPYLIDHSLTKQPKDWSDVADLNPVIPMTMTFELLVEAAHKQDLSKKVLRLGPVSVFQWMNVHTPFSQTITGTWKTEEVISVGIKDFANGEVVLGNAYPAVPVEYSGEIDLGSTIITPPTPKRIYEHHMFHGPGYQGIKEIQEVTKKGLRGIIKKEAGKGSLLDNIGQMYGLYLQLTLDTSNVSFPVKVDEINFYQDIYDQEGVFECICIQTALTEDFSIGDIIIKRDGKVWCIVRGWKNMRFIGFDERLWDFTMAPAEHLLSKEIAPDVYFYYNEYNKAVNWDFIMKTYLNREEKAHFRSLQLNKQKDYLISRITVKDGARGYIQKKINKKFFPIEFSIKHDSHNKPSVIGRKEVEGLEISIAHKGTNSVSIISDKPVGIDIEIIENRDNGFLELTFTKKELELLKDKDLAEWSTRFWVAKEAYGKMLGVGLKGNPKQYEIESINEENLLINGITIKTMKHNINFIIGWTL